jgi:signal transduction histidine kinase
MKTIRILPRLKQRLFFSLLVIGILSIIIAFTISWMLIKDRMTIFSSYTNPTSELSTEFWNSPLRWLLVATLGAIGFFAVMVYLVVNITTNSIREIAYSIARLAKGEYIPARIPETAPEEFSSIVNAINQLSSYLLTQVNEMRGFVANASHELRTPLTTIKLRIEALRNGAIDDSMIANQYLVEIDNEIDRLGKMVNDLLDLTQIEANLANSPRGMIDFAQLVNEVCASFATRADREGLELRLHVNPNIPGVLGVEDRLRRLVYNLVDNAIKYTAHGGIISINLQYNQLTNRIRLEVIDTGYGIAAPNLPHIFKRFYRVDATRPRYGTGRGSGLGLAIAKSIVDAHEGEIGAISEPGRGSTFFVELPISKAL